MAEIRHYFSFAGRARRAEYWGVRLFVGVCSFIASLGDRREDLPPSATIVVIVLAIVSMWMSLTVEVRRLHDLNRSGWWLLGYYIIVLMLFFPILIAGPGEIDALAIPLVVVGLCVFIGVSIWLGFFRGTHGPNLFGPEPQSTKEQGSSKPHLPLCPISGKGLLKKLSDQPAYQVLSPATYNPLYYLTESALAEINKHGLTEKQKEYLLGVVWKRSDEGRTPTTLFADDIVRSRQA